MILDSTSKCRIVLCLCPDELWLKGRNQAFYWKILQANIRSILKNHLSQKFQLEIRNQRFFIFLEHPLKEQEIQKICLLPGVNTIQPGLSVPLDWDSLLFAIKNYSNDLFSCIHTFGVRVRRANKQFFKNSLEMQKELGTFILDNFSHLKVSLKNPDLWLDVRVLNNCFYFFSKSYKGSGGLPVGSSGKLISLISGGIDSPVSTYLMATRGCKQDLLFCYAYPFVDGAVEKKLYQLAERLSVFQSNLRLYVVPFSEVLEKISSFCEKRYRTLFFRHCMLKTAELLATRLGYSAIVTGDSLAQVSSQTLSNIAVLDSSTQLPILRPLIGLNKSEIIKIARQIGTYNISIQPYDDVCTLLSGDSPVLRADKSFWSQLLKKYFLDDLLETKLDDAKIYHTFSAIEKNKK